MSCHSPITQAIRVTDPHMPPRADYDAWLDGVWDRAWLTNEGPLCRELARRLCARLGVERLHLTSSGTSALMVALSALGVRGSVVTTPYSFAATANAALWQGCRPIFADIDADTLCLDPGRAEAAITPDTTAILATHVYGMPCDHAALAAVAARHGLSLVYDAAHAFGSRLHGRSLLDYGDAAAISFHATKIFHCGEGGAVIAGAPETHDRATLVKANGIEGDEVRLAGLNAKMSELHAAMGLCVLEAVDGLIDRRRRNFDLYRARLSDAPVRFLDPAATPGLEWNYAYCPIFFDDPETLTRVQSRLKVDGIDTRRYFRPALNTLAYTGGGSCPVAESLADRALCLPLGATLTEAQVETVSGRLRAAL